jgi:hypothetical protein
VDLFKAMVAELDDPAACAAIREDWKCVRKSTADLVQELGRPQDTRNCDSQFSRSRKRPRNQRTNQPDQPTNHSLITNHYPQ